MDIVLSALEIAPAEQNRTAAEALDAVRVLAGRLDDLGYRRLWLAEHHASPWASSVVPAVLAAHFAAHTSRIRIGSGGVLAPNHAPRALAEQFATLAVLHPGRIDIGIGRGPGTHDIKVVKEMRRGGEPGTDAQYQADVRELLRLLSAQDGDRLISGPVEPVDAAPFLLSSSESGAALAAELGLPIAFAHHIRPDNTQAALALYRERFTPSRWSSQPYAIVALETIVAETDEEAAWLGAALDVVKVGLFTGKGEIPLVPPEAAEGLEIPAELKDLLAAHGAWQVRGGPETAARQFAGLSEATGADEFMLLSAVYEPQARVRSFELAAKAVGLS